MKMKKSYIAILVTLILVIVILGVLLFMSEKKAAVELECDSCNLDENSNSNNADVSQVEKEYDCSFTQTYRVVNLLDGYIAEVPELSYVVLDKFQGHSAISHIIPTNLKDKLEVGKYYEFTYQLKGKGYIENMDDIYQKIPGTVLYSESDDKTQDEIYQDKKMFVYLTIEETDKEGMDQLQDPICEGKAIAND